MDLKRIRDDKWREGEEAVGQTETELSCTFCVRNGGWLAALDMRLDSTKTFTYIYIYIYIYTYVCIGVHPICHLIANVFEVAAAPVSTATKARGQIEA